MRIEFETNEAVLTVKLIGELDHHIAKETREKIDFKLNCGIYNKLIFDFTNLSFMDSSGIALIMGRVKNMQSIGGKVYVLSKDEKINRIITMSGLTKYITLISE